MDITDEAFVNAMADACRAGIESEQARIIKLLENTVIDWRKCDLHNQADTFDYAIALIKGEK